MLMSIHQFVLWFDVYTVNGSLAAAELKSKENVQIFLAGIAEAGDDPYKVPDSEVELTKESTEADIGKAAVAAAFTAVNKDDLKVCTVIMCLRFSLE